MNDFSSETLTIPIVQLSRRREGTLSSISLRGRDREGGGGRKERREAKLKLTDLRPSLFVFVASRLHQVSSLLS